MSKPCQISNHAEARRIATDLLQGASVRTVASRYNLKKSTVAFHVKNHVTRSLKRLATTERNLREDGERAEPTLMAMGRLAARTLKILDRCERDKNYPAAIAALNIQRKNYELIAKLCGAK